MGEIVSSCIIILLPLLIMLGGQLVFMDSMFKNIRDRVSGDQYFIKELHKLENQNEALILSLIHI